jgi:hypothetical protein
VIEGMGCQGYTGCPKTMVNKRLSISGVCRMKRALHMWVGHFCRWSVVLKSMIFTLSMLSLSGHHNEVLLSYVLWDTLYMVVVGELVGGSGCFARSAPNNKLHLQERSLD